MAEENKIQDAEIISTTPAPAVPEVEVINASGEEPKKEEKPADQKEPPKKTQPQVVVKKDRGISFFVGFILLTVLSIVFFFIPGITLVYLVSLVAAISAPVAWMFGALLSVIIWLLFKLKIKGFKKSFFWYIGLCVILTFILTVITVATSVKIWGTIFALLCGGSN